MGLNADSLLERVAASPINYWATFVTDLFVAVAFAWLGAIHYTGPPFVAAAAVLAGLLGWPLLEYVVHRWLLHGRLSAAFRKEHARHHRSPQAIAGTPWLASALLGVVLWAIFALLFSGPGAALVMAGIYSGYIYFVIVHRLQHYHPEWLARSRFFRNQTRLHELHHGQPDHLFGITFSIWDRVFRTFREPALSGALSGAEGVSGLLQHDEVVVEQPRR